MELSPVLGDRNHVARAQLHEKPIPAIVVYAWKTVSRRYMLCHREG